MTVRDLLDLFVCAEDINVVIFDCADENDVYNGPGDEIPSRYEYAEICGIDNPSEPDSITINVDTDAFASYIGMFDRKIAEEYRRTEKGEES